MGTDNPNIEITFPLWLLGSTEKADTGKIDAFRGVFVATSNDGERCCTIFASEEAANEMRHNFSDKIVVREADLEDLDSVLKFYSEKQGIHNVLIGHGQNQWQSTTIAQLRFAIAMHRQRQ